MSAEYDRLAEEKKRRQLAYAEYVLSGAKPLYHHKKSESKSPRRNKNILKMPNFKID
ncbi:MULTISPECIES: hypothetical protein [unclassified Shewanella]|uniref:hypothetical protein n=1 Tax=unclassified Shewanella TaxID=196818 RepID=UPI0021D8D1DB|nr:MULTISPECIES: hypothetical protein [unclassified Shewanella]MCU8024363.1 hypothetical protein [Shewanella sp. SM78]MCU8081328.1 hypothetical protein [Shewanella sp. SM103]